MIKNLQTGLEFFSKVHLSHKDFTRPYIILPVLHQIATEYILNQKSDQIHVASFYHSFHIVGRVIESGEVI